MIAKKYWSGFLAVFLFTPLFNVPCFAMQADQLNLGLALPGVNAAPLGCACYYQPVCNFLSSVARHVCDGASWLRQEIGNISLREATAAVVTVGTLAAGACLGYELSTFVTPGNLFLLVPLQALVQVTSTTLPQLLLPLLLCKEQTCTDMTYGVGGTLAAWNVVALIRYLSLLVQDSSSFDLFLATIFHGIVGGGITLIFCIQCCPHHNLIKEFFRVFISLPYNAIIDPRPICRVPRVHPAVHIVVTSYDDVSSHASVDDSTGSGVELSES